MKLPAPLWLTAFWIALCAYFTCIGWGLSAIHQLNGLGYSLALLLGTVILFLYLRQASVPRVGYRWAKFKWRARHGLPAVFFLLTGLAFIGGALYAPNNYDALTYRFPRILHWLAEGQWHWIETPEKRLNLSGTGFEWLMIPLFVFSKGDRLFFLINIVSQLLLPGLIYTTFTRLGIGKRVAWAWMWLLPCGYCFVLQAGSIGNDTFAVPFLLASIAFFLLAKKSARISHVWVGILAAGLLTGAKACNLPLLLPCFIAALPSIKLLKKRPFASLGVALIASLISFLPMAALNTHYVGDWTGEPKTGGMKVDHPGYGILGNSLQFVAGNITPPIMPFAKKWNEQVTKLQTKRPFPELVRHFPRFGLAWNELAQEEVASLGFGLTLLLFLTALAILSKASLTGIARPSRPHFGWGTMIGLSGAIALLVYMAKLGSESGPRLIAAYYPTVIACVLLPHASSAIVRKRWWKITALLAAFTALSCVILTPGRPLFPAETLFTRLAASHPQNGTIVRACQVYNVYGKRADSLAPLRRYFPSEATVVGFIGADDSEVALWRPFGSRRVMTLSKSTKLETMPQFLVATEESMQMDFGTSVRQWVEIRNAKIIGKENFITKIIRGPQDWYVIALPKTSGQGLEVENQ